MADVVPDYNSYYTHTHTHTHIYTNYLFKIRRHTYSREYAISDAAIVTI